MRIWAFIFALILFWGLKDVRADGALAVSDSEGEVISKELASEAQNLKYDERVKQLLNSVSEAFNAPKDEKFFKKMGRSIGKGAAWITTTTAKPFAMASGFVTGVVEKQEENKEVVALYQFFLKYESEFDHLPALAGTPEEFIELMLLKVEEITTRKGHIIMRDFLASLGIEKEIGDFELTSEEIAKIDLDRFDVSFINSHPEYQDLKPILGEIRRGDILAAVASGYYDRAISFESYRDALPKPYELVTTILGQIYGPRIALGIISKSLAGLYSTVVIGADIAVGISVGICLKKGVKDQFKHDEELKNFCSYVTNRTGYQLMKSRAKGYVSGKKMRIKIDKKLEERRARRARKKEEQEKMKAAELM